MNKNFIKIHKLLEKGVIYQFSAVFLLALIASVFPSIVLKYTIAVLLFYLLLTTALCLVTTTIWIVYFISEMADSMMKPFEELLNNYKKTNE